MNIFTINSILIAVISIPLAIFIAVNAHKEKDRWLLALFTFAVSVWGIGGFFIANTQIEELALFYWRLTHIGIILIPTFFFHFVIVFLKLTNYTRLILINYVLAAFFQIANANENLICCVRYVFNEFYYDSPPTISYIFFTAYFVAIIIFSHYLLITEYKRRNKQEKMPILYVLLGAGIGFLGGIPSFLPVFRIDIYPVLNFSVPFFALFIAIGVFRYQLFRIKVIATELFVAGLWVIIFFQFFALFFGDKSFNIQVIQGITWLIVVLLSAFLIRSVRHEVEQRERLESLSDELTIANQELRRADEQKSDFITIASHQLRTPLSIIKGYISLIFENSFGKTPKELIEPLNRINISNNRLINLVNELLDLSRIERGKMTYVFQPSSIAPIAEEVFAEMQESAKVNKLEFTYTKPETELPLCNIDPKKIKEVMINFVENAIRYTSQGFVRMYLDYTKAKRAIRFTISDSGVGLTKDEINHLFVKFSRMEPAKKISSEGTGLGLYVAKLIIEDHKGKIWAESDGSGKGTRFIFELPAI